ncbi:hypothetical protein IW262DRAFT_1295967 [Armillaria fumosa]|nr:hypothetical protein IW262DRAFT_1295967 [Armillaria fumosa]
MMILCRPALPSTLDDAMPSNARLGIRRLVGNEGLSSWSIFAHTCHRDATTMCNSLDYTCFHSTLNIIQESVTDEHYLGLPLRRLMGSYGRIHMSPSTLIILSHFGIVSQAVSSLNYTAPHHAWDACYLAILLGHQVIYPLIPSRKSHRKTTPNDQMDVRGWSEPADSPTLVSSNKMVWGTFKMSSCLGGLNARLSRRIHPIPRSYEDGSWSLC